jgi:hypothetical protein
MSVPTIILGHRAFIRVDEVQLFVQAVVQPYLVGLPVPRRRQIPQRRLCRDQLAPDFFSLRYSTGEHALCVRQTKPYCKSFGTALSRGCLD